ncbi:MAG TPA: tannase/feruloyl esterase family alpha/beta hydrolase, partial [Burkholderiaceae bacterium]|nr:tannase/feruloyl esterase family alpha/beta hydrolase [Burkholderiaceae bacterium]
MGMSNAALRMGFAVFLAALLAGCGGGGGGADADSEIAPLGGSADGRHGPPPRPLTCTQLAGKTIPASSIDLPTSGATVTSAVVVAAAGTGAAAIPEHCLVNGKISPIDTSAPDILFRVALPTDWNAKVVMFGGGGFNGTIPNVAGNVPAGPTDQLRPLGRGYATFASDSGHQANALGSLDGSFGLNDEAIRNWSGEALKKTR